MESKISELGTWLTELFTTTADEVARECGFAKRCGRFQASDFVQTLVFGWLDNHEATLEDFADELNVSAPAVHDRFHDRCVAMMRQLVEKAAGYSAMADPVDVELLNRFDNIYVEDATSVSLLAQLQSLFPGCGGADEEDGAAGMKCLFRFEGLSGKLCAMTCDAQRTNDLKLSQRTALPDDGLYLADLGFFCLQQLASLSDQGTSWRSRVPSHITVRVAGGSSEKLSAYLRKQTADRVDSHVALGEDGLPCRLVAIRCPAAVAAEKKRRLYKKMKKKGKQPSEHQLVMCEWLVLVTNLPEDEYTPEELWALYRVRWQIELVFKRWKSVLHMDTSQARTNKYRRLTELYAKLLGCLITHWTSLRRAGLVTNYSLHTLLKRVRKTLVQIAPGLKRGAVRKVIAQLHKLAKRLANLKPRAKRNKKPGTMEILNNPELVF